MIRSDVWFGMMRSFRLIHSLSLLCAVFSFFFLSFLLFFLSLFFLGTSFIRPSVRWVPSFLIFLFLFPLLPFSSFFLSLFFLC